MAVTIGAGELYSIACALAWAIAVVLFKKSGESLPPFALNLFKNGLGLLLMLVTLAVLRPAWPELPPSALGLISISGLLGIALGDTLYLRALNVIGAGRMGVAQTFYSPCVIVLSALFLGEQLRAWQLVGVALVLAGIALATYVHSANHLNARRLRSGVLLAGTAVFVMAAAVVIAKPLLERYDFFWIVTLRLAGGLLGMLVLAVLQHEALGLMSAYRSVRHWPQIIAGAVTGTYLSTLLWLAGYKYTSASIAAVLNELAAIFILALAALFLHERITGRQRAGCVLALAGVALVVVR